MAIFQCDECGCAEDTAWGWLHNALIVDVTLPEHLGTRVCSACAPAEWGPGRPIEGFGAWHDKFPRVYYPHKSFRPTKAYKKHGRKTQYKKPKE